MKRLIENNRENDQFDYQICYPLLKLLLVITHNLNCVLSVHNYGSVDLVFDYSVSLLERHLSLVRSLQFDFSSICFCGFVVNGGPDSTVV